MGLVGILIAITTRRGGAYTLTYDNWADRDQTYDFDRLTADAVKICGMARLSASVGKRNGSSSHEVAMICHPCGGMQRFAGESMARRYALVRPRPDISKVLGASASRLCEKCCAATFFRGQRKTAVADGVYLGFVWICSR